MASELSIFLVLIAVARSSLAQNTSSSCLPLTQIGSDLATLKLGEDMARYGYRYFTQVLFDEILAILAERAAGHHYNPNSEYAKLRAAFAENRTWTGFLLGTNPTLDAMRLINNSLDVASVSQQIGVAFRLISANIVQAIKRAQGYNYEGSRAELTNIFATAYGNVENVAGMFTAAEVPDPAQTLSKEDESVAECVAGEVPTNLYKALTYTFNAIYLLLDALRDLKSNDDVKKYSSKMLAIRKKVVKHFDAEVRYKFSGIRNRLILNYLRESPGTLATLMALEVPYDDYTSV